MVKAFELNHFNPIRSVFF